MEAIARNGIQSGSLGCLRVKTGATGKRAIIILSCVTVAAEVSYFCAVETEKSRNYVLTSVYLSAKSPREVKLVIPLHARERETA